MAIIVRPYETKDIPAMCVIWNEVVEDGIAFPQMDPLDEVSGAAFFHEQSFNGLACEEEIGEVLGLYILHPNNVGRCGHIANASYAVNGAARGKKIGELLVRHSLAQAKALGFQIMQFNAVVASNHPALRLYERLGFVRLGTIPKAFLMKDGHYEDIVPHYHAL